MLGIGISTGEARLHLEQVLASAFFRRSAKASRFLVMMAEVVFTENPVALDERMVAHEVFLRPHEFDPKSDSIVRVEAARIRTRLKKYSEGPGKNSPLVLGLQPGTYRVEFTLNPNGQPLERPLHLHATTPNTDAFALFLKARRAGAEFSNQKMRWSMAATQQLSAQHPGYALSHVGEADALLFAVIGGAIRPLDAFPRIEAALERALQIDPQLAPVYLAQALLCILSEWDWAKGLELADKGLQLGNRSAHGHLVRGSCLVHANRLEDAVAEHHRAIEADPMFGVAYAMTGEAHIHARQFEAGEQWCRTALRTDPSLERPRFVLSCLYLAQGRTQEALAEGLEMSAVNPSALTLGLQGACLAAAGKTQEARAILKTLLHASKRHYVDPAALCLIWMRLPGGHDAAVDALTLGLKERSPFAVSFPLTPVFDRLGHDSRVQALADSLKIPGLNYSMEIGQKSRNVS